MHIRSRVGDLAQRWGLELTLVSLALRDVKQAEVRIGPVISRAQGMELFVCEIETGVTGVALSLSAKQIEPSPGRCADRSRIPTLIAIEGGIPRQQCPFKCGDSLRDPIDSDGLRAEGLLEQRRCSRSGVPV